MAVSQQALGEGIGAELGVTRGKSIPMMIDMNPSAVRQE